jgi:hypothetical protein
MSQWLALLLAAAAALAAGGHGGGPALPSLPCGTLRGEPALALRGGHSPACFSEKPVSYEYCRLLLAGAGPCSALTYANGNCWLHDRTKSDFAATPKREDSQQYSVSVVKLTDMDHCSGSESGSPGAGGGAEVGTGTGTGGAEGSPTALQSFEACMLRDDRVAAAAALPLLGIVVSVTEGWARGSGAELRAVAANLRAYCATHPGYSFHLNVMKDMNKFRFFHYRHAEIAQKYLPR